MFSPLSDTDWPEEIAAMRQDFAGQLNVYRVMAHHPALLQAWKGFRTHCVLGGSLTRAQSEVVILRCGHRLGSDYEWKHHICRGRDAGLTDAQILSLRGEPAEMEPELACLAGAVDALFDRKRLTPEQAEAVSALAGRQGVLDLMATVAHYSLLGFILNSFEVPVDQNILQRLEAEPLRE